MRERQLAGAGLIGLGVLAVLGWLVTRERLLPRRPVAPRKSWPATRRPSWRSASSALLVVATNPFALIFVLPSLHVWLWLPQVRASPLWTRVAVLLLGFSGPALLLWSFAPATGSASMRRGTCAWLYALGYAPLPGFVIALAWAAGAGQLLALTAGRYAPYPSEAERPPRGPHPRDDPRGSCSRGAGTRASDADRRALHG